MPVARVFKPFQRFIQLESASGLLLFFAALTGLAFANSPLSETYASLKSVSLPAINDGLMAVFFLLVGLEIKREMWNGELASFRRSAMPFAAALGGMLLPAVFYSLFNRNHLSAPGWGIPMATDIAFALGALMVLGKRIPPGLKIFLVALAIIDDLGAILVIALFYTQTLHWGALALSGACLAALFMLNFFGVRRLLPYLAAGALSWFALLHSGVHATLAGVALAFFIPMTADGAEENSLQFLERKLHPWVGFGILPIFALVNAGVALNPQTRNLLAEPVGLGILAGLCLGKPLGISLFSWIAARMGFGELPTGVRWRHLLGAGMLGGIGFTMSLFIADLGLPEERLLDGAKLAVLCASVISGMIGIVYLAWMGREKPAKS